MDAAASKHGHRIEWMEVLAGQKAFDATGSWLPDETVAAFREYLIERGLQLVEVPDEEFDSMGANVLAIAPRHAVMVAGNPRTRARLEAADVRVDEYRGHEISLKGGGGPTCLTRPIARVSS